MVAKWEPRIDVTVAEWRIRRMKTCNREAGRIWLNSELAKKPVSCLEYVVVHEMVHLIEREHNGVSCDSGPGDAGVAGAVEDLNRGWLGKEGWGATPLDHPRGESMRRYDPIAERE